MLGLATWAAPARLRLTLNKSGAFHVTTTPLPTTQAVWRLGMARQCLFSDDPWLQVKSSRRTAYDTARADIDAGLDEVILLNERAEVCDGTITTLFFDRGAGLRTPPLTSGLLPGVLRGQMLAEGACAEEVLSADDLPVVRLWVGNSLRGLAPAVWQG
jgi:4-amino-4-deoxychorismate lyase